MDYFTKPTFTKDELIEINKRKAVQKAKGFIASFRMRYPTNAVGVYENFDNIPEEDVRLYKEAINCLPTLTPEKVENASEKVNAFSAIETAINVWLDSKNNCTVYTDYSDIDISDIYLSVSSMYMHVSTCDLNLKFYYNINNQTLSSTVTLYIIDDSTQHNINKTVADQLDKALEKISTASIF